MNTTIKKCLIYIIVALLICLALNFLSDTIVPIISNDIAMGQLENDNFAWLVSTNWLNNMNIAITGLRLLTMFICGLKCGLVIYNYNKENRKENENE
jgi:uncharacterized membrane protein YraQ (UPF0718 family)